MGQRDVGRDDGEEERVWVVVTGAAANDDSALLCCRRLWLLRVCDNIISPPEYIMPSSCSPFSHLIDNSLG